MKYIRPLAWFRAYWLSKKIRARIPANGSILIVGSGRGYLDNLLSNKKYSVVSIEPDTTIQHAKSVITEPFETVQIETRFDCIVFSYVLHHMQSPEKSLARALSFLNEDGKIFVFELGLPSVCRTRDMNWKIQNIESDILTAGGKIYSKEHLFFSPLYIVGKNTK